MASKRPGWRRFATRALLPTLFLFFAITLAVDPPAHLDRVRLGYVLLDSGVQTPQGPMVIGSRLVEGIRQQFHVDLAQFQSESQLREATLAHEVAGGIVFPPDMTRNLQDGQPVDLRVTRSDANDPFTNAFLANLPTQLSTNLNAALPAMLKGGTAAGSSTAQPATPLVSVGVDNVAATNDFRFATIPAFLLLPLWMATVAFSGLLARAGNRARQFAGLRAWETGLAELAVGTVGAAIVAAVVTVDLALFTWRWDLDFAGLFGFLWLGLTASAWVVQGTVRLLGLELGALLGLVALFVQQPVSGANYPAAFAPDAVSWAEGFAPLRYLVEGLRNLLIGGTTTAEMTWALAMLAGAGILLFAGGIVRLSLMRSEEQQEARPIQPVPSA